MKYRVFLDANMYPQIETSDAMPEFRYVFRYRKLLSRVRLVSDLYRTIVGYYEFEYLL
jgi:hypothetical protein